MPPYKLIPLNSKTKVSDFDCGNQDLNDFIREDALDNQTVWLSVTMTLESEEGSLIGFYTIAPDTLHKGRIDITDKLAEYPYQKYPAIKLARLAVDTRYPSRFHAVLMSTRPLPPQTLKNIRSNE